MFLKDMLSKPTLEGEGMGVDLLELISPQTQLVGDLELVESPCGQITQELTVGNGHLLHGELLKGLEIKSELI